MSTKPTLKTLTTCAVLGCCLCASFSAFAQNNSTYNPNIQQNFQGFQGSAPAQDWQTSAAGAAAAASSAASAGMNNAVANAATGANTANAAASYQQNASAQFLQSSAPASSFGQSGTGYTNDGTLMMGGNKIGNPHQVLHDAQASSLFGITAVRYTFTDNPSYGQGTLAQIQTDMTNAPISSDPTRLFSRLYLTATNPYTQGVATPHNNYQTYQGVVADAQAGSYQLTVADDNKLYAFKTLSAPNQQAMNILIKELPNTSQFKGSTDLKGGATGVHVTQSGDAAALQNYLATVKPYDFSWRSAMGAWADGNARPSNITAELGQFGNMPIGSNEAGTVFADWVMGSSQVQTYQAGLQNQSMQTGNEGFGVLAWDANQNKYVMLNPTNQQATSGSVSGNMPTLGNNQFGFFGMHTHSGSATPSGQDYAMTQQLGLDQMVIGTNGTTAIMTSNPGNNWQGAGFEFERSYLGGRNLAIFGSTSNAYIPQHGYIVTGADYLGDPKAVVTSFGPTFINGVPYLMKKQLGTDTSTDDIKDWLSKDGNFVLLVDKNGIPLDDKTTQEQINKVSDNLQNNPTIYYFVTQNSNSAPVTAATNNGAVNATIPGNSPGSTHSVNSTPVSYPTVDSMGVPTGGTSTY